VGICVYDRPPGYNPNEDNIVRSQARLLRLKLEHHFANEGKDEAIVITIPKGRYLPAFENRSEEQAILRGVPPAERGKSRRLLQILAGVAVLFGLVIICLGYLLFKSRSATPQAFFAPAGSVTRAEQSAGVQPLRSRPFGLAPGAGEVRIAAGHIGALMWTRGGTVGKRTVTTKEVFRSLVRGISSPLSPMRACSEPCGKRSPPI
jgi:hypothetical protein